jgi:hypothetical protein
MADGLIATIALEHDLMVVTRNVRDFADLGIGVFNPWTGEFREGLSRRLDDRTKEASIAIRSAQLRF